MGAIQQLLAAGSSSLPFGYAGYSAATATSTAVTVAIPAQTGIGDLLVCCVTTSASATWSIPSGWTQAITNNSSPSISVYYRQAQAGVTSYPFSCSVSGNISAVMVAIHKGNFDQIGTISLTSPVTGITVTNNGSILFGFGSFPSTGNLVDFGNILTLIYRPNPGTIGLYSKNVNAGATGNSASFVGQTSVLFSVSP